MKQCAHTNADQHPQTDSLFAKITSLCSLGYLKLDLLKSDVAKEGRPILPDMTLVQ
jgi:hypothetical protein